MWDKLRDQVAVEREQLHRLIGHYRPVLDKCAASPPDDIELSALAAMLHSFYNGIEIIFKRTALELGGRALSSEFWHKELLDSMSRATGQRSALLSPELHGRLKEYMEFRHFFRHAYTFDLQWVRMKALVLGCEDTLTQLENELDRFLEAGDPGRER